MAKSRAKRRVVHMPLTTPPDSLPGAAAKPTHMRSSTQRQFEIKSRVDAQQPKISKSPSSKDLQYPLSTAGRKHNHFSTH